MRNYILPILLIAFAGEAGPQASQPVERAEPGNYRISVNVDLVVLNATVRDPKGGFVSDLRKQDFEVYEDGVKQSLGVFLHEDVPVTVGLVVDHSGSTRTKLIEIVAAARSFVRSSNPEDEMFVVNFNEKVSLGLPAAIPFTNRSEELERAILKTPADGMTALYDAIARALEQLGASSRDKKVLIVISDGGDNASALGLSQVLKKAGQSSAMIYTIGIFDDADPDRNPGLLRRLARETGGEAFFPAKLNEVVPVCERIAHDIRNQYTLGYVSANTPRPGAYHAIRVAARPEGKGKLMVRTRAGYIAAGDQDSK